MLHDCSAMGSRQQSLSPRFQSMLRYDVKHPSKFRGNAVPEIAPEYAYRE